MPTHRNPLRLRRGSAGAGQAAADVVVLDADLYKSTRTVLFRDAFPNRFIDIGISEADMVSTAAGMAASGLMPFVNQFAIFLTGICYDPDPHADLSTRR